MKKVCLYYAFLFIFSCSKLSASAINSVFFFEESKKNTRILEKELFREVSSLNARITETIREYGSQERVDVLELHNERGINFFLLGEIDQAIEDFDYVLNALNPEINSDRQLIGTALWGRMLCHAFSNSYEKTAYDAALIRYIFLGLDNCNCGAKQFSSSSGFAFYPHSSEVPIVVKFATPNEKLSPEECSERVEGTAKAAKLIVSRVRDSRIQWLIYQVIDEFESFGYSCCRNSPDWTRCLDPIVNAWQKLKNSMSRIKEICDSGAALAPYLAGPK